MTERTIFETALDIEDAAQRRTYIEQACGQNKVLLAQVIALLELHQNIGSFLEPSIARASRLLETSSEGSDLEATGAKTPGVDEAVLRHLGPATVPDALGTLAHYDVLGLLGQGGYGVVFRGYDRKLLRPVAIKMLHPMLAVTSPPRKRFLREARAGASVKHDNVVQVYAVEEDPIPFLVTEFVDGVSLQDRLDADGPLELPVLLSIGQQAASGLAAAHEKNIIHRDIKPANILLERGLEEKVKLTDFGLARAVDDASLTRSGAVLGTPLYMSPEQSNGGILDPRSDLFSLGSVLYAMASGRPPFRAETLTGVLKRVAEDTPRPLRDIIPELPVWLVAIINRLLAKDPDQRFSSGGEVSRLLGSCLDQLRAGVHVSQVKIPGALLQQTDMTTAATRGVRAFAPRTKRSVKPRLAAGVVVLLCAAGAIAWWFASRSVPISALVEKQPQGPAAATLARTARPKIEASAGKPVSDPASEHTLAEWLLDRPGMRQIGISPSPGGSFRNIKPGEALPSEPFLVTQIDWPDGSAIHDEDLVRIGQSTNLHYLTLGTFEGHPSEISDAGLSRLLSPSVCRTLRSLDLHCPLPNVTDKGYLAADRAHELVELDIRGLAPGCGTYLSRLTGLTKLVSLRAYGEEIPSGWIETLPVRMPAITTVATLGMRPTSADLATLPRLSQLTGLGLEDAGIDDSTCEILGKLKNLSYLLLSRNPKISDAGVAQSPA